MVHDNEEITKKSLDGFGMLIGYFVGIVTFCYVLDISGIFDPFVKRLGDRAYRSFERDKRYTDALESKLSSENLAGEVSGHAHRSSLGAKERADLSTMIDAEVDNTLQKKEVGANQKEKNCCEKFCASCCCCYWCLKRMLYG